MSTDAALPTPLAPPPAADGSPWSEAPPAALPVHWREGRNFNLQTAAPGESLAVHLAGFCGTVIAGALFAVGVLFLEAFNSPGFWGVEVLFVSIVVAFVGGAFAGIAATFVFPLALLIQSVAGLSRWRAVLAAIAGGWSGLAATFFVTANERGREAMLFQIGAMVMGQVGAGHFARSVYRGQVAGFVGSHPDEPVRLKLRQLFGIMSAVAVVAALVTNLPLTPDGRASLGIALAVQCALTAVTPVLTEFRRRVFSGK